MTLHHAVSWQVDTEWVDATFTCDAPEGADCRLVCAEECGADFWPCHSYDEDGDNEREHRRVDGGSCLAVDCLKNEEGPDSYDREAPRAPLRSGPIVVRWTGDELQPCVWSYPPEGAAGNTPEADRG